MCVVLKQVLSGTHNAISKNILYFQTTFKQKKPLKIEKKDSERILNNRKDSKRFTGTRADKTKFSVKK